MAAPRLTEEDVHAACAEIVAQGERPTTLLLYDKLGRGSMTTISKYLSSWHATDEAQTSKADSLPAVVKLPAELAKEGEDLLKKMWNVAKGIADEDLDVQREALKQAEQANQTKVEEAFKFSEAQSMKIDRLEDELETLKAQLAAEQDRLSQVFTKLNESEKVNVGLSKDNERLRHEADALKGKLVALEDAAKTAAKEKHEREKEHDAVLKQKNTEVRTLDMQVHKLQTSLDAAVTANERLQTETKDKSSELSKRTIEAETLGVRYQAAVDELKTVKADLKAASHATAEAEKAVANLQGQLAVYTHLASKAAPE